MVDFIIVGRGLAASVLMHEFHRAGLSFNVVGDPGLSVSSIVAPGVFNPAVFKRMTRSWMAAELMPALEKFYGSCEKSLGTKLLTRRTIIKPFTEDQEKKLWQRKAEAELRGYIDPEIHDGKDHPGFTIRNGYGLVNESGNVDLPAFLTRTAVFFRDFVHNTVFDYPDLKPEEDALSYKSIRARNIIFCEGYLARHNPWFGKIPLKPAKGQILTIRSEELRLKDKIFAKDGFIMDVSPGEFRAGATYEWEQPDDRPTPAGRRELEAKIRLMTALPYTVIRHEAGVRPSSVDRRPIIGRHPVMPNFYIFNGLGAKGVMLAPYFAGKFVHFYLKKEALPKEVDVQRFYPLL